MHKLSFPELEHEILKYWEDIDAFQTSYKKSEGRPIFKFFDGPPFATGLPHYGHLLAGTIKDVVTRYATQTGFRVERRFGWDCHGLPVEHEIDKSLGIKDRREIETLGIGVYNEKCRSIVQKYASEWRHIVTRVGRWIDFDNDYKTLNPEFMESVWWVFSELWKKNLVYRGVKVMPYSVGCATSLSNFEAGQDYQEVSDPAVTVAFKTIDQDYELVAWTTTPWTLPSNLALGVNPTFKYIKIEDKTGRKFVVMKDRVSQLFKKAADYKILAEFPGSELVGVRYEPLFDYFASKPNCFRIIAGDYITNDSGTGIVHLAPGFGEEDFNACLHAGVITKDGEIVCPIDDAAKYTSEIYDMEGIYVKDADNIIIQKLKENGRLIQKNTIVHKYPFCWRSHTPLIYRTVPSWYVRVEDNREVLIKNTLETRWVPQTIRDGRFIEWLKNARDWAISRSRYWGTPIPIWTDADYTEFVVVGSIEELKQLTKRDDITDIHRHFIDDLEIISEKTGKVLKRIPEVFDCWFESGSMPFAQHHIPFSGEEFRAADFIAEGLDQTRGWFYTLTVLSSLLGHTSPFKNLIVNGLILAKDGKKMSKSLRNYPDPISVVESQGADALRLYLINSPAVRAEPMKFDEDGVQGVVREVMLPWMNTLNFFLQQKDRFDHFARNAEIVHNTQNTIDMWILSRLNRTIKFIRNEMANYRLYTVLPELLNFLEDVTNWYIKLNRNRMKTDIVALSVLYEVLYSLSLLMSPFAPFFAEFAYQKLKPFLSQEEQSESVHYVMIPEADETMINEDVEAKVTHMKSAILVGRLVRDRNNLPIKRPLLRFTIVCNPIVQDSLGELITFVKSELNVLDVDFDNNESKYVKFNAKPDGRALGQRLRGALKEVMKGIDKVDLSTVYNQYIHALRHNEAIPSVEIAGHMISADELNISRTFIKQADTKFQGDVDGEIAAVADISSSERIEKLQYAREFRSQVLMARKKAGLLASDKIIQAVEGDEERVREVINSDSEEIRKAFGTEVVIGKVEGEVILEDVSNGRTVRLIRPAK